MSNDRYQWSYWDYLMGDVIFRQEAQNGLGQASERCECQVAKAIGCGCPDQHLVIHIDWRLFIAPANIKLKSLKDTPALIV